MYFKLTPQVWWGDRSAPEETRDETKAVLCLAHNHDLKDKQHRSPFNVHIPYHLKPYFWLPRADEQAVDTDYLRLLDGVAAIVHNSRLHPVLVHCYAGQHRSPITAIYLQLHWDGFSPARYCELERRARELRQDITQQAFGESMRGRIQDRTGRGV